MYKNNTPVVGTTGVIVLRRGRGSLTNDNTPCGGVAGLEAVGENW
jgi:hypothetical protein